MEPCDQAGSLLHGLGGHLPTTATSHDSTHMMNGEDGGLGDYGGRSVILLLPHTRQRNFQFKHSLKKAAESCPII